MGVIRSYCESLKTEDSEQSCLCRVDNILEEPAETIGVRTAPTPVSVDEMLQRYSASMEEYYEGICKDWVYWKETTVVNCQEEETFDRFYTSMDSLTSLVALVCMIHGTLAQ